MVFWLTYPLLHFTYSLYPLKSFISYVFNKEGIKLGEGYVCEEITASSTFSHFFEITNFLKKYFGKPPLKPILDIPPNDLLGISDIMIIIRCKVSREIIGSVRYHYIGNYISSEGEKIYVVDCFCIHPLWRNKGLGDYLLTHLHQYANKNNIPYALFLKEGSILSIIHLPFYTGTYVYRSLEKYYDSKYIYLLTKEEGNKMLEYYYKIYPNTFIIQNRETLNQLWKIYKKENYFILVCFQDTYQRIYEDNKYKKID